MKINNVDIDRFDTMALLKARRTASILVGFFSFFLIMCLFMLVMCYFTTPDTNVSSETQNFITMTILIGLGGSCVFFFFLKMKIKEIIAINNELVFRQDLKEVKALYKKDNILNLKLCGILVGIILVLILLVKGCSSIGGSTKSSGGCRNCGRSGLLVPGYGYCYDCFNGFSDWEKRTNK